MSADGSVTSAERFRLPHLRPALTRWDASILQPARSSAPRPSFATAYRPQSLVVHTSDPVLQARVRAALDVAVARHQWIGDHQQHGVQIRSGPGAAPVDAWAIVSEFRAAGDPDLASAVGLDHLMTSAEQAGGNPFAIGHGRAGLDGYGRGGYSGRGPVQLLVPPPPERRGRRPRVVILDTGLGEHPWFTDDDRVSTTITLSDGTVVGPEIDPSSIRTSVEGGAGAFVSPLVRTLASHTGHGTFIAGLIRQACPQADIVALAVMGADGMVPESTLTDGLALVADRQRQQPGWADALVLSLGYYAETDEDRAYGTRLQKILVDLSRMGVAIFCAAGNDASSRPSYPAAFAAHPAFSAPDVLPLVSVAALNPDGSVAAFSNDGPWVLAEALGVNLVSTAPVGTDGSLRPAVAFAADGRRIRAGVDPDNFTSGFASWSGTSFAAPVLAGRYLSRLTMQGFPSIPARRGLVPLGRHHDRPADG